MTLDEIEEKVAQGKVGAEWVFMQMSKLIINRNDVVDEAIAALQECELVPAAPSVKRIRLYEAVGALMGLKDRNER